jgi:restriction endonuclease S subunit
MATRHGLQQVGRSDLGPIFKGVNKIVKDVGKELTKEFGEEGLKDEFHNKSKKTASLYASVKNILQPNKPYPTPVPSGFVDMQRRLSQNESSHSKLSSTIKIPKAIQKSKWQQMLDDLEEEQEELDERQNELNKQKKLLKKLSKTGGMNRKSKRMRINKKKMMYTRRRVR